MAKANFEQHRNDLFWEFNASGDGRIIWTGYDDNYWWNNISKSEKWRNKTVGKSGRTYILDVDTSIVTILEKSEEI